MHMFYWKFQTWVDQRLASIWNLNWWAWASLHWFLTPAWSQLLFTFPSGLFCHHHQGFLACQKEVKPTALQSLPNLRHMALGLTMCDMFQKRNLAENSEKTEKSCEGLFYVIASLWSHFKKRWVGTVRLCIQMYMNPMVLRLFLVFPP